MKSGLPPALICQLQETNDFEFGAVLDDIEGIQRNATLNGKISDEKTGGLLQTSSSPRSCQQIPNHLLLKKALLS